MDHSRRSIVLGGTWVTSMAGRSLTSASAVDSPAVDDVVARLGRVTRNLYASVDDLTDKGCTVQVSTE